MARIYQRPGKWIFGVMLSIGLSCSAWANERSDALVILAEIRQAADKIGDKFQYVKPTILEGVAEAQAAAGDIKAASQTVAGIEGTEGNWAKSRALAAIALAQVASGDLAGAQQTAKNIPRDHYYGDFYRAQGLTAVAVAEAKLGNARASKETFMQAIDVASKLSTKHEDYGTPRESNLKNIAKSQAKAGFTADALRTADLLPAQELPSALAEIGSARAETGDFKEAEDIAARLSDAKLADAVQAAIISAKSRADKSHKMNGSQNIQKHNFADCGRSCLPEVEALAASGKFKEARSIADAMKLPGLKSEALGIIVKAQVKAGDLKGALEMVKSASISDYKDYEQDKYRDELWLAVVEAQSESGDTKGARQTAESIHKSFWKSIALNKIARAEAAAGNINSALQTASAIEDDNERYEAFEPIARAKVKAHDLEGALKLALSFGPEPVVLHARILAAIAVTQAEMGDAKGAHETVSKIQDECVESFAPVAAAQVRAGDSKGAIAWALSGKSPNPTILAGVIDGIKEMLKKYPSSREVLEFHFFELSGEKGCY